MPRIPGTTDAASTFLRSFRTSPAGPPPDKWPAPSILRRWLRRPAFRAALKSIQETLRLQADFHLSSAATRAAAQLETVAASPSDSALRTQHSALNSLLRLSHLRQRFSANSDSIDSQTQDDVPSELPEQRPISFLDVRHNLHLIPPEFRLTQEELRHVAWKAGYPMHLRDFPDFPPPVPQDSFYYYLIMEPSALLWYFKLYGEKTGDHRHSPILASCPQLIPREFPNEHLPRFRPEAGNNINEPRP